jgi:hypothetical protein
MIDVTHIAVAAGTGLLSMVGTVAAIKTDLKWLRAWTEQHQEQDARDLAEVNRRLGVIEGHLLK